MIQLDAGGMTPEEVRRVFGSLEPPLPVVMQSGIGEPDHEKARNIMRQIEDLTKAH